MINRIQAKHTPSFKSVYIRSDFKQNLNKNTQDKTQRVFDSLQCIFPQNDIFIHRDFNKLIYRIQKAHTIKLLATPEALTLSNDIKKTIDEINIVLALDAAYKNINNIKVKSVTKEIKNFEYKSEDELNQIMINDVLDFNYDNPEHTYEA